MATWVPGPSSTARGSAGNTPGVTGKSYPEATGPTFPTPQNSPATAQPAWIPAPAADTLAPTGAANAI